MKRFDERDVIFSRMNYKEGSQQFRDYYSRNPDKKEIDDELRLMPQLGSEGTATYDPVNSPIVDACFNFLGDIKKYSEGIVNENPVKIDPEVMTKRIKGLVRYYNAKLVGITEMQDYHYYSHRGRESAVYGKEVDRFHKFGIVFAVEMDKDMIFRAPQISEGLAVTKGYIDAAVTGMVISYYIRALGYDARNHMDGNYLVIAPLVAQDAGLGEIGRNGILITKEYGPRVRLGVVTTDMPLICDKYEHFGVFEFCSICKNCVRTCPGKAISPDEPAEFDKKRGWKIDHTACYKKWRSLGGDCGICLSSCPFSDSVPGELLNRISGSESARQEILEEYRKKHGIRPYIKEPPEWLK